MELEQERKDEELIQGEFDVLLAGYLESNHRRKEEIIKRAFLFAKDAHAGVRRRSGEPYIMHPLSVAKIVCHEMGLGSTSICAALLHDVVEDTDYTVQDIANQFGDKIANIVDGLTKISSGMFGENVSAQAENFRKLLLTMSDDIRVILVKIADRLHNMRTLGSMAPAKQYKIAGETMYIYAPLAHRLGLFAIKTELEELSFKWENPETYASIVDKLEESHTRREGLYNHFAAPVKISLDKLGFKYEIKAREKSVYSIWKKMHTKNIPFEEIYDLFAVRVIFEMEEDLDEKKRCWDIYSCITDIYKLRPERIRDWVSSPKANGYQALHLTVMGPDGQWIEIQIRSRRMHEIAEKGFAAHWKYKEGNIEEDNELDKWLKTIQEILENPNPNALDFLDTIKLNLFSNEIFVFTPKGEIRTLPQGATALDFAYDVHSDIGDKAIGAKVNYKLVPISHKLSSGDQVEILTSKTQTPQKEWLDLVSTAKARTKLEYALRKKRREVIVQGEDALNKSMEGSGAELTSSIVDRIVDYYRYANKDELFYAIGNKDIDLPQQIEKILNQRKDGSGNFLVKYMKQAYNAMRKSDKNKKEAEEIDRTSFEKIDPKKTYELNKDSFNENFVMTGCCNPIPGDNVFGFLVENNTVEVHSVNCQRGQRLKANYGDRIINLIWNSSSNLELLTTIVIKGIDKMGMLNDISQVITASLSINIKSINLESKDGVFEGRLIVYVHDVGEIHDLTTKLRQIKGVKSVLRVNN